MGGFFGAASRKSCKYDVFFGTDYHSHLGTKRGGLVFYDTDKGFQRQIHQHQRIILHMSFSYCTSRLLSINSKYIII